MLPGSVCPQGQGWNSGTLWPRQSPSSAWTASSPRPSRSARFSPGRGGFKDDLDLPDGGRAGCSGRPPPAWLGPLRRLTAFASMARLNPLPDVRLSHHAGRGVRATRPPPKHTLPSPSADLVVDGDPMLDQGDLRQLPTPRAPG